MSETSVTFGGAVASSGADACEPGQALPWTVSLPAFNQHKNGRATLIPWDQRRVQETAQTILKPGSV